MVLFILALLGLLSVIALFVIFWDYYKYSGPAIWNPQQPDRITTVKDVQEQEKVSSDELN